jgi:hypothetical protein
VKPQVRTREGNEGSKDANLFIEDLFAEVVYGYDCKAAEENADEDKGTVRIFHKEIDEPPEHHIQKIAWRVWLVNGNVIVFKGKGKLNRIPVIEKFACEGDPCDDGEKK